MTRPGSARSPRLPAGEELHLYLENIRLKALDKEPGRRYVSVDVLAADVKATLQGRPISAQRVAWRYIAGKFVCRSGWAGADCTQRCAAPVVGLRG